METPSDERPQAAAAAIACTLQGPDATAERLGEWADVMVHVTSRSAVDGGVRLQLDPSAPLDHIVVLAAAEQRCCAFFAFALTIDARGAALEVRAPVDAQAVLAALFDAG